jgi:hypothetical protein
VSGVFTCHKKPVWRSIFRILTCLTGQSMDNLNSCSVSVSLMLLNKNYCLNNVVYSLEHIAPETVRVTDREQDFSGRLHSISALWFHLAHATLLFLKPWILLDDNT